MTGTTTTTTTTTEPSAAHPTGKPEVPTASAEHHDDHEGSSEEDTTTPKAQGRPTVDTTAVPHSVPEGQVMVGSPSRYRKPVPSTRAPQWSYALKLEGDTQSAQTAQGGQMWGQYTVPTTATLNKAGQPPPRHQQSGTVARKSSKEIDSIVDRLHNAPFQPPVTVAQGGWGWCLRKGVSLSECAPKGVGRATPPSHHRPSLPSSSSSSSPRDALPSPSVSAPAPPREAPSTSTASHPTMPTGMRPIQPPSTYTPPAGLHVTGAPPPVEEVVEEAPVESPRVTRARFVEQQKQALMNQPRGSQIDYTRPPPASNCPPPKAPTINRSEYVKQVDTGSSKTGTQKKRRSSSESSGRANRSGSLTNASQASAPIISRRDILARRASKE